MNKHSYQNFQITTDDRGVVRVVLDIPDRPINVLDHDVIDELGAIVAELHRDTEIRLVVFESGKESGFLVGADVSVIADIDSDEQAETAVSAGQQVFEAIERLDVPTIALIHGPCLGGGLELALACRYRIARDNEATRIGLPEIKLGLIPGWGGTQRLPRLIGLTQSVPMILQGKHLDATDAARIGLIDYAFSPETWASGVEELIERLVAGKKIRRRKPARSLATRFFDSTVPGRFIFLGSAERRVAPMSDQYPALRAALRAIKAGYQRDADGFAVEKDEFVELLSTPTCKRLMDLFFARERARNVKTWSKDHWKSADQHPIQKLAVIGGGAMGAGIAQLAAHRGFDVVIKEIDEEALQDARGRVSKLLDSLAKRKRWDPLQRDAEMKRISFSTDTKRICDADLVIEAVVEREDIKCAVFADIHHRLKPSAIIATNTSSLSIDRMSAVIRRTSQFAGLHFFNPVHRMELVEVVRGAGTSPQTLARLVAFVRALGKTPIVTTDCPGFLVNRVLFPYLGEAVQMVREGYAVDKIDTELKRFGMPMGPCQLLDQVGLDVALHVAKSLRETNSGSDPVIEQLSMMIAEGKAGRKSERGFYHYVNGKRREPTIETDAAPLRVVSDLFADDSLTSIQRRLVYPMLAEATRCLHEGVVDESWAVDLGMVLGTGFAPHRGGPLRMVDSIGLPRVVENMRELHTVCGARFMPPQRLVEMADQEQTFFGPPCAENDRPLVAT